MSDPGPFTRRMVAAWIAAAVLTFAASIAFMLHGDDSDSIGPSTFSRSAIGYAGIADILQRRGLTVIKSQGGAVHEVGARGLLVIAEPQFHLPVTGADRALLGAPKVLLVLPKWQGQPDRDHPGWIGEADPLPPFVPQAVLSIAAGAGQVVRPDKPVTWQRNDIGFAPHLAAPVQLMTGTKLRPIVAGPEGMLLGEQGGPQGRRLWVLSDPDVLDNHGLADGHAAFALSLFETLSHGHRIVFDETVHGFDAASNPAAMLLHPRLTRVAALGVLALALVLWAGAIRFGAAETPPAPLKAGKRDLVQNVAGLFRFAGYQPVLVRRYVEETIRFVARRLGAPRDLDDAGTVAWLQRLGAARGVTADCGAISARAGALSGWSRAAGQTRLPAEIWQWKQEMMHGGGDSAGHRRGDPRGNPQGGGGAG